MNSIDLKKYSSLVSKTDFVKKTGKVSRIIGLVIEGDGPSASVGSLCTIYPKNRMSIQAQVVGFQDKRILLMPLGDIAGIEPGSIIESTEDSPTYRPSNALIGRVIDGMNVVGRISRVTTGSIGPYSDVPTTPVIIKKVSITSE